MRKVLKTRRMGFEALEDRQMLAGGVLAQVVNQPVPVLDILPGGQNKVLAELKISTIGRQYARLTEVLAVPATNSEPLAWNTQTFVLRADLNGKTKDGCEAIIAKARADYETDLVDFNVSRAVWVRPKAVLKVQIVASFNGYYLSGDTIGVEAAEVSFRDLRNNPIPDERVAYRGVDPTLHTMENKMFSISQSMMDSAGTVLVGQEDVKLVQFNSWWSEAVAPGSVTFVAGQGNLANATNYSLLADYNWDGTWDSRIESAVVSSDGRLTFSFAKEDASHNSALYEVHADIADALPTDPRIQLVFTKDGSGLTATNMETNKLLRGVQFNGTGEGQIRLWQSPQYSTAYAIVKDPELFVKELPAFPSYAYAKPGAKDIVLDAFSVYDVNDVTVNYVAISAADGDLGYCTNYVIWWDSNNDSVVDTAAKGKLVGKASARQVVFEDLSCSIKGGQSVLFEVHADVLESVSRYAALRTQFAGIKASRDNGDPLPTDKIFLQLARQTYWMFYDDGGLG